MLNEDYKDILLALSVEKVSFLLVGAYALAVHGLSPGHYGHGHLDHAFPAERRCRFAGFAAFRRSAAQANEGRPSER